MIMLMIVIITIMRRQTSVCFDNSPQCVKTEISVAENRPLQYCKPQKQASFSRDTGNGTGYVNRCPWHLRLTSLICANFKLHESISTFHSFWRQIVVDRQNGEYHTSLEPRSNLINYFYLYFPRGSFAFWAILLSAWKTAFRICVKLSEKNMGNEPGKCIAHNNVTYSFYSEGRVTNFFPLLKCNQRGCSKKHHSNASFFQFCIDINFLFFAENDQTGYFTVGRTRCLYKLSRSTDHLLV